MACITHCRNCGDIDQRHSARLLEPDIPDGAIQPLEADLGSLLLPEHLDLALRAVLKTAPDAAPALLWRYGQPRRH